MLQKFQQGGTRVTKNQNNLPLKQPKISIITVVFNSAAYLRGTIESVLNQSYPNYEYIIIDGGSTDGTIEIIKEYEHRLDYWLSQSDRGIYDAMNKGIKLAQGQIIGILNSGDFYTSNALAEVVALAAESEESKYLVITGAMYRFDEQTGIKFEQKRTEADLERNINLGMPINHPATFITKNVYEKIGCFNPEFKICGDHDLIFRVYHSQLVDFIFTDHPLASMSMGGVSETLDSLWIRAKEKIKIRQNKLNLLHNIWLSGRILLVGWIKHFLIGIIGQKAVLIKHKIQQKIWS
ncbi:MAG: hypothetical protein Tsb0014_01190 [Pleurocapsa sp.]